MEGTVAQSSSVPLEDACSTRRHGDDSFFDPAFRDDVLAVGLANCFAVKRAVAAWRAYLSHHKSVALIVAAAHANIARRTLRVSLCAWRHVHAQVNSAASLRARCALHRERRAWDAWRLRLALQAAGNRLSRACDTIQAGLALRQWRARVHSDRRAESLVHRLPTLHNMAAMRTFLARMRAAIAATKRSTSLQVLSGCFHSTRVLTYRIRGWRAWMRRRRAIRDWCVEHARCARLAALRLTFRALASHAHCRRRARGHEFLAFAHYESKAIRLAFRGLLCGVAAQRGEAATRATMPAHLLRWRTWTNARILRRRRACKADAARCRSLLWVCFHALAQHAAQQRAARHAVTLADTFRRFALQQGVLTYWHAIARSRQAARSKWVQAVVHHSRWLQGACFAQLVAVLRTRQRWRLAEQHNCTAILRKTFAGWQACAATSHNCALLASNQRLRVLRVHQRHLVVWWAKWTQRRISMTELTIRWNVVVAQRHRRAVVAIWRAAAGSQARESILMVRALAYRRRVLLLAVLRGWHECSGMETRLLAAWSACTHMVRARSLGRAWVGWQHLAARRVEGRQRIRALSGELVARQRRKHLSTAVGRWLDRMQSVRVQQAVVRGCRCRATRVAQAAVFAALLHYKSCRAKTLALRQRADALLSTRTQLWVWRVWMVAHREVTREVELSRVAFLHRAAHLQRQALAAWKWWYAQRRVLATAMLRAGSSGAASSGDGGVGGIRRFSFTGTSPTGSGVGNQGESTLATCLDASPHSLACEPLEELMAQVDATRSLMHEAAGIIRDGPEVHHNHHRHRRRHRRHHDRQQVGAVETSFASSSSTSPLLSASIPLPHVQVVPPLLASGLPTHRGVNKRMQPRLMDDSDLMCLDTLSSNEIAEKSVPIPTASRPVNTTLLTAFSHVSSIAAYPTAQCEAATAPSLSYCPPPQHSFSPPSAYTPTVPSVPVKEAADAQVDHHMHGLSGALALRAKEALAGTTPACAATAQHMQPQTHLTPGEVVELTAQVEYWEQQCAMAVRRREQLPRLHQQRQVVSALLQDRLSRLALAASTGGHASLNSAALHSARSEHDDTVAVLHDTLQAVGASIASTEEEEEQFVSRWSLVHTRITNMKELLQAEATAAATRASTTLPLRA